MNYLMGIVGYPVAHSLSPTLFRQFLQADGKEGKYFYISAGHRTSLNELMAQLGLCGVNVTAPYKASFLGELHSLTDIARTIGCVNAVKRVGDELLGHNTDYEGILGVLKANFINAKFHQVVVLGAGGAARAVVKVLTDCGCDVTVVNRNREHGERIAHEFGVQYVKTAFRYVFPTGSMLFSCLPPGSELPDLAWDRFELAIDSVYFRSPIKDMCAQHRIRRIGGYEWLVHQAVASYNFLTDGHATVQSELLAKKPEQMRPTHFVTREGSAHHPMENFELPLVAWGGDDAESLELIEHEGGVASEAVR